MTAALSGATVYGRWVAAPRRWFGGAARLPKNQPETPKLAAEKTQPARRNAG
jgi:hypothetical protein